MNWELVTQIVVAVLGLIGTVDILRLLFVKEDKKGKQVQNVDAEVAVAQHANNLLSQQLERSHETILERDRTIAEKDAVIESKNQEIANLREEKAILCGSLCIHHACRIRDPRLGQGARHFEQNKHSDNLGGDNISIDTLIKQDRAKRLKLEKEADAAIAEASNPKKEAEGTESVE